MKFKTTIIILLALIISCLLLNQCNNSSKNDFKAITDTLIVHKVDTIRDTLKVFKIKEKTVFLPIEINKPIDTTKYNTINKYRLYNDTLRDSNIVIYSKKELIGYLTNENISYKLLVPYKIYDSVKITINNNIYKNYKNTINIGVLLNNTSVIPSFEYKRYKNTYMLGYDIINNRPYLGYKYSIYNK